MSAASVGVKEVDLDFANSLRLTRDELYLVRVVGLYSWSHLGGWFRRSVVLPGTNGFRISTIVREWICHQPQRMRFRTVFKCRDLS